MSLRPCEAGDEVLMSYGERANDDFFLHYGFVPDSNPHDAVPVFDSLAELKIYALAALSTAHLATPAVAPGAPPPTDAAGAVRDSVLLLSVSSDEEESAAAEAEGEVPAWLEEAARRFDAAVAAVESDVRDGGEGALLRPVRKDDPLSRGLKLVAGEWPSWR